MRFSSTSVLISRISKKRIESVGVVGGCVSVVAVEESQKRELKGIEELRMEYAKAMPRISKKRIERIPMAVADLIGTFLDESQKRELKVVAFGAIYVALQKFESQKRELKDLNL